MAEHVKTRIILTIIIGLFGLMCFGFAVTVTDKYKTQRDRANLLEKKLVAGKEEILKIPEMREKLIQAEENAASAQSELQSVQEELDETTAQLEEAQGELEDLKAQLAAVSPAPEKVEVVSSGEIEETNKKIALLTEERSYLQTELSKARETIKGFKEKGIPEKVVTRVETKTVVKEVPDKTLLAKLSEAEEKVKGLQEKIALLESKKAMVLGGTKEKEIVATPGIQRGLGAEFRKKAKEEVAGMQYKEIPSLDPLIEIKNHVDIVNAKITQLLTYASEKGDRRVRIGLNAYKGSETALTEKDEISRSLNEIMEHYTKIGDIINDCEIFTSLEKGLAKNSLSKRISKYIAQLLSKNEAGGFKIHKDADIKLLLSKIQEEQKYFFKPAERLAAR